MKKLILLFFACVMFLRLLRGDETLLRTVGGEDDAPPKPALDPKRIVNRSFAFLKEREPEMTAEEYALYEKMVSTLSTNPEFGIRLLEAMVNQKDKPSPAFLFVLGNAYYAAGKKEKAEVSYRGAVDGFPTFQRAWNNLGILYYTTERFGDAVACLSQCVALGDRDASTFGLLGYCLERQGNLISAEQAYMQALSSAPANRDAKEGLLRIYTHGRQYERAEWVVKGLIKDQPKDTRLWFAYANLLIADDRKLEAIVVLEAAAGVGAAGAEELTLLADLYAEKQLVPEAIATYGKALAQSAEVGEPKFLRYVQMLVGSGKLSEAEQALTSIKPARLTSEGVCEVLRIKIDILQTKKQWTQARAEAERLLTLAPLDAKALLCVGRSYAAEGDAARATFAFEQALKLPATAHRACLELANIELKNRHFTKAISYLEKALGIEKSDTLSDYLAHLRQLAAKEPS